jgi:hypothetical protein
VAVQDADPVPRVVPRGRRRGVIPNDVDARIDAVTGGLSIGRFVAKGLVQLLEGYAPEQLTAAEHADLVALYESEEHVTEGLRVLSEIGYGQPRGRTPRPERVYGVKRAERLNGLLGKLPRALALRVPTSADTHRHGPNDGQDRWGQVRCSSTLRAGHLGLLAAGLGLWHSRNPENDPYTETTAGELAHLLVSGVRRQGGKDIAWVQGLLADLDQLELSATAPPALEGVDVADYEIPCSPVDRVEMRLPGTDRWVSIAEYSECLEQLRDGELAAAIEDHSSSRDAAGGTVRIHYAPWVLKALAERRSVLVDFTVWAHLRPTGQRIYAFCQASHKTDYDGAIAFYLAAPQCFTFGLTGRRHRSAKAVRHALDSLRVADHRYSKPEKWSTNGKHAGTRLTTFRFSAQGPTRPTELARTGKCLGARPGRLRGLSYVEAEERARLIIKASRRPAAPRNRKGSLKRLGQQLADKRAGP